MRTRKMDIVSLVVGVLVWLLTSGTPGWNVVVGLISAMLLLIAVLASGYVRSVLDLKYSGAPNAGKKLWNAVWFTLIGFSVALLLFIVDGHYMTAPVVVILGISLLEVMVVHILQSYWRSHPGW